MWIKTISGCRFLEVEKNNQGFYIIKKKQIQQEQKNIINKYLKTN